MAWLRDYDAPENGGLMYVEPAELGLKKGMEVQSPRGVRGRG